MFNAIDTGRAVELLGEMDPDDRVDLLQELEEEDATALLSALERREPEAAEEVRELVQYEPETAGGRMTTELPRCRPTRRFGKQWRPRADSAARTWRNALLHLRLRADR